MRHYPEDDYDKEELEKLKAKPWMVDCLKMNPSYISWGPYEDYMCDDGKGWDSRQIFDDWESFGPWTLDEYNEVVNFYFEIGRDSAKCEDCDGQGLNPETFKISQDWYSFERSDWIYITDNKRYNNAAWQYHLTELEIDALWEDGRLSCDFKEKPTPEQINKWAASGFGHDSINHWICVKARAKNLGVYGKCEHCQGEGHLFTEDSAKLGLVLWVLHPRKGCSRGIHIKELKKDELNKAIEYLKEAEKRNTARFFKLIT